MFRHISRRWQIPTNPENRRLTEWLTDVPCECALCVCVQASVLPIVLWPSCVCMCAWSIVSLNIYHCSLTNRQYVSVTLFHSHPCTFSMSDRSSSLSRPSSRLARLFFILSVSIVFRFYCTVTKSFRFGELSLLLLPFAYAFFVDFVLHCLVLLLVLLLLLSVGSAAAAAAAAAECVSERVSEWMSARIYVHTFFCEAVHDFFGSNFR